MNQSALIGGALLAGFALFITSRNRLSTYGRILWGAKPSTHSEGGEVSSDVPIAEREKTEKGLTDYKWMDILTPIDVLEQVWRDMQDDLGIGE